MHCRDPEPVIILFFWLSFNKNHMQQRGLDMSIIDQNFDMSSSCHIANVVIQIP